MTNCTNKLCPIYSHLKNLVSGAQICETQIETRIEMSFLYKLYPLSINVGSTSVTLTRSFLPQLGKISEGKLRVITHKLQTHEGSAQLIGDLLEQAHKELDLFDAIIHQVERHIDSLQSAIAILSAATDDTDAAPTVKEVTPLVSCALAASAMSAALAKADKTDAAPDDLRIARDALDDALHTLANDLSSYRSRRNTLVAARQVCTEHARSDARRAAQWIPAYSTVTDLARLRG